MNEAEYLIKNYGDQWRVLSVEALPPWPTASTDNTLLDLHNS